MAVYAVLFGLLILPIPIVFLGILAPLVRGGGPSRPSRPLVVAIVLNLLALPTPFLLFFGFGFLVIPALMFAIGSIVATTATAGRWWQGALAAPWFALPLLLYWALIAFPMDILKFVGIADPSPDQMNPAGLVLLWFAWWGCGVAGAGFAGLILRGRNVGKLGRP